MKDEFHLLATRSETDTYVRVTACSAAWGSVKAEYRRRSRLTCLLLQSRHIENFTLLCNAKYSPLQRNPWQVHLDEVEGLHRRLVGQLYYAEQAVVGLRE